MRVLQISDLYPPVIGGTERHTQRLAIELAERGHESMVATLQVPGAADFEIGGSGERVYRLPSLASRIPGAHASVRPYHPPFPDPLVRRGLREVIAAQRPDVVYAHNWIVYSYASIYREFEIPLVYVLHDYCMTCPSKTLIRDDGTACTHRGAGRLACARETYGAVRGAVIGSGLVMSNKALGGVPCTYVAISDAVAEATTMAFADPPPVRVIPTFVAGGLADRARDRPRPALLPDEPYILFVGALSKHKGVHLLLEAYDALETPKPQLLVLAARANTDMPPLPPNVSVYVDVDHADVMVAWRDCLFGVVPSLWPEPFGQVAIEALTMGRAVVASDGGGLRDIVRDGVNGLLFEPGSAAALTAAMKRLLTDDDLRESLQTGAAAGVERYTIHKVADDVEALLKEVAQR